MKMFIIFLCASLICLPGCSKDDRAWEKASQSGTAEGYGTYIASFGASGKHYKKALEVWDKTLWDKVTKSGDYDLYIAGCESIGTKGQHYQEALKACDEKFWDEAEKSGDYRAYIAWRTNNMPYAENSDRIETAKLSALLNQPTEESYRDFLSEFPETKHKTFIEDSIKIYNMEKKFNESPTDSDLDSLENAIADHIKNFGPGKRLVLKGINANGAPSSKFTSSGNTEDETPILRSEFPSDALVYSMFGELNVRGNGTISRVDGIIPAKGLNVQPGDGKQGFISSSMQSDHADKYNRMTFVLLKDIGLVYVRGNGTVKGQNGEIYEVGNPKSGRE